MCQLSPPSKGIPKVPPGQPLRPLKANQCLLLDLFWSSTEPTSILTNPFRDISRYIDIESWPQKRKHYIIISIILSLSNTGLMQLLAGAKVIEVGNSSTDRALFNGMVYLCHYTSRLLRRASR